MLAYSLTAQERLSVIGWNLESGDADVNVIANRIEAAQGVDIWGFSEVENEVQVVAVLEAAAEDGEDADYQSILGTTGGNDRLLIIYDADRLSLLQQEELSEVNVGGNVSCAPGCVVPRRRDRAGVFFSWSTISTAPVGTAGTSSPGCSMSGLMNRKQPVIAAGDYNYDWDVEDGDEDHDDGF